MLQKHRSLIRAEHVVNLIVNDDRTADIDGTVESYQNGREQGLQITYVECQYDKAFFISEHRNVDDVVVYVGKPTMQSLSEDAYNHANFFHEDGDAAEFVIVELEKLKAERIAKDKAAKRKKEKAAQ